MKKVNIRLKAESENCKKDDTENIMLMSLVAKPLLSMNATPCILKETKNIYKTCVSNKSNTYT